MGLVLSGVVGLVVLVLAIVSIQATPSLDDGEIPPPFSIEELSGAPLSSGLPLTIPTLVKLRGAGTVLAVGSVGETVVAVSTDGDEVLIWTLVDGVWSYSGGVDADAVVTATVSDNRILIRGSDDRIPFVWEWIDGRLRTLFQPPTGWITGVWSVGGRLVVATSVDSSLLRIGDAIESGRRDELWLESPNGQFVPIDKANMTTVLTVNGVDGSIVVGGSEGGSPTFGFLRDNSVTAEVLPAGIGHGGVTDIQLDLPNAYVLVSLFDDNATLVGTEIRAAGSDWKTVADSESMLAIDSLAGRLIALDVDGRLIDIAARIEIGSSPFHTIGGTVAGLTIVGDAPLVFGAEDGQPAMAVWGPAALRVSLPSGPWQRYHSEASDGYQVIHVGSREFAMRGTGLFVRAWNSDRWHPTVFEDEVLFFGQPRIAETDWGYVLAPLVGSDLYRSVDGSRWERVETALGRIGHLVTNGSSVIAMTSVNSSVDINAGPTTEVVLVTEAAIVHPEPIPKGTIAPGWAEGLGFYASVAPGPSPGYFVSQDGLTWSHMTDGARYDLVTAVDGQFYWWSGEAATAGRDPIVLPGDAIGLVVRGQGVVVAAGASGSNWLRADGRWIPIGFGVSDGLPGRPSDMIIRDGVLYAFVETGVSREVWMFEFN